MKPSRRPFCGSCGGPLFGQRCPSCGRPTARPLPSSLPVARTAPEPPAVGLCLECRDRFDFNSAFYRDRGIAPPGRCRPCRAARQRRLVAVEATMTAVSSRIAFARCADGTFFVAPADVARLALVPGDRVSLSYDPAAPVTGRAPRALRVARL